jgi:hypothetical protein
MLVTVMVVTAVFVLSATDLAVSVTVAGLGTLDGAVYVIAAPEALAFADRVPQAAPLHPTPLKVQLTPLFCVSFCKVAVMLCVCPVCTETDVGFTAMEIVAVEDAVMVTVAAADFVPSATDVAVAVTVAGFGTVAGAVYVTATPEPLVELDSVPQLAPLHPAPDSVQLKPLFWESFWTVAVSVCPWPCSTDAVEGETATEIAAGVTNVACAVPDLSDCACDTAVMLTTAGDGTVAGA